MKTPFLSLLLAVAVITSPALLAQDANTGGSTANLPAGGTDTSGGQ